MKSHSMRFSFSSPANQMTKGWRLNMFNKRTLVIIKRELRSRLFSKSFILSTVLIPVFLMGILAVQTFLVKYQGDEKYNLEIITTQPYLSNALKSEFGNNDRVKSGNLSISYNTFDSAQFEKHLEEIKSKILKKSISGVIFIPEDRIE